MAHGTGYALFDTSLGRCGIAWSDQGLLRVQLPEASETATRRRLTSLGDERRPPAWVKQAITALARHVDGRAQDLSKIPLDLGGVPEFARRVYRAARRIPAGKTATYGELARRLGSAGAARAVGGALGKNPFAIVIPCHRVLTADGGAGGFSAHGGIATKARLLRCEGVGLDASTRAT